jgi:hypothetical protein
MVGHRNRSQSETQEVRLHIVLGVATTRVRGGVSQSQLRCPASMQGRQLARRRLFIERLLRSPQSKQVFAS